MNENQNKETPVTEQNVQDTSSMSEQHVDDASAVTGNSSGGQHETASSLEYGGYAHASAGETPEPEDDAYETVPAKVEDGQPPFISKWSDAFNSFAKIGPLYLLAFLCFMIWPDYWHAHEAAFCPPEIQSVTAYLHCIQDSSWLAPMALENGGWTVPQWPLFYMFIGLLAYIPGIVDAGWLTPLACATSAAIALVGAFFFTHAAGFGVRAAFAAGLILLCAPIFAPLHHFFGPMTLATGLMLFALAFFCRGWRANHAWISLPLAFIFTALAGLCGGVLYVVIPLVGSLIYLIWQGRYKRGQTLDAIVGFLLFLIIIGCWMVAISLGTYPSDYLRKLFADSIQFSWPPQRHWFLALIGGAVGVLPWLLIVFGVSWFRVLKDGIKSFGASRHANGSALMWISLVLACCASLFVPHTPLAAITIAALLAPLLGKAFIRMSPAGNRFFFLLASLFTIFVGGLFIALHFEKSRDFIFSLLPIKPPAVAGPELQNLDAIMILGGVCILAGLCGLFFVRRPRGGGGMIYASIVTVIIGQIALFMIAPALQDNPRLPLKKLDAIVQEVEAAKLVPQAPQTVPDLPVPSHDLPPAATPQPENDVPEPVAPPPTIPDAPETPVQDQENRQETMTPEMQTVPANPENAPAGTVEPGTSQPEQTGEIPQVENPVPSAPELPQEMTIPSAPEVPEAGIPVTLPDAIEVPQSGKVEIPEAQVVPPATEGQPQNPQDGQ